MTEPVIPKNLTDAIDRIARTPDGVSLYLYCQRKLMSIGRDVHTLPQLDGERRFALELIGLMTKGLVESGGRSTSTSDTGATDAQPIVYAAPEPVARSAPRGAGRRITADTRVPGYDIPDLDG